MLRLTFVVLSMFSLTSEFVSSFNVKKFRSIGQDSAFLHKHAQNQPKVDYFEFQVLDLIKVMHFAFIGG